MQSFFVFFFNGKYMQKTTYYNLNCSQCGFHMQSLIEDIQLASPSNLVPHQLVLFGTRTPPLTCSEVYRNAFGLCIGSTVLIIAKTCRRLSAGGRGACLSAVNSCCIYIFSPQLPSLSPGFVSVRAAARKEPCLTLSTVQSLSQHLFAYSPFVRYLKMRILSPPSMFSEVYKSNIIQ